MGAWRTGEAGAGKNSGPLLWGEGAAATHGQWETTARTSWEL
jgi:hypothetical protein